MLNAAVTRTDDDTVRNQYLTQLEIRVEAEANRFKSKAWGPGPGQMCTNPVSSNDCVAASRRCMSFLVPQILIEVLGQPSTTSLGIPLTLARSPRTVSAVLWSPRQVLATALSRSMSGLSDKSPSMASHLSWVEIWTSTAPLPRAISKHTSPVTR